MVRAVLEGVCLELRWIIQAAERLGTPIDEVRIWGGAAKSKLWNQIAADVYGVPAITTETPEAGLLGAAVCAAQGVGIHKNAQEAVEAMVRVAERYQPNPESHDLYNQKYAIYQDFFFTLKKSGIFERLEGV
jgi:xylulokinase